VTLARRLLLGRDRLQLLAKQVATVPRVLRVQLGGHRFPVVSPDRDFGNLVAKGVQQRRVASSTEAVQRVLREARALETSVTVRAAGHSSNGQTLSAGGIQLVLSPTGWPAPRLIDRDLVEVAAASSWRDLQTFLRAQGLSAPVLTDNLNTTVGGTLSVGGGIGMRSLAYGRQLDQVERLRLVLPNGDLVWCSAETESELFRNALGGLGQVGVLDTVVMRALPHRPLRTVFRAQFRSLEQAVNAVRAVVESERAPPDLTCVAVTGPMLDTPVVEAEFDVEADTRAAAREHKRRLPELFRSLAAIGVSSSIAKGDATHEWRSNPYVTSLDGMVHLWNDYFFSSFDAYLKFVRYLETTLFRDVGNEYMMAGLAYWIKTFPGRPHAPLSMPRPPATDASGFGYTIGVFYSIPPDDSALRQRIQAGLSRAQQEVHRLGGRLYLYGWHDLSPQTLRDVYGADHQALLNLKRQVDPDWLLNPEIVFGSEDRA
jgi:FAD/FMN-containing dehydrogenase